MRIVAVVSLVAGLVSSTCLLQGCTQRDGAGTSANAATTPAPAQTSAPASQAPDSAAASPATQSPANAETQAAYVPPTAAQLIRLLAPIAAFPDTLVAQVLAASTYPEQVAAAQAWSKQNTTLRDAALQKALEDRDWDPSVKALVAFPDVLNQMASNAAWTQALGDAFANDPTDVMNAIQALRAQALACGNLKSNRYINVTQHPKASARDAVGGSNVAAPSPEVLDLLGQGLDPELDDPPPTYAGPAVIASPERVIEIAPVDPEVVYVPRYDPVVFFGAPIPVYPGYAFAWPAPIYYGPAFGGWGFGFGISVRFGFGHPWGWGAWGLHWGPGFGYGHYGFYRPAVVFNSHIYVSRSTTVVNHFAAGSRPFVNPIRDARPGPATSSFAAARSTQGGTLALRHSGAVNFNGMTVPKFANTSASANGGLHPAASVAASGAVGTARANPLAPTRSGATSAPARSSMSPTSTHASASQGSAHTDAAPRKLASTNAVRTTTSGTLPSNHASLAGTTAHTQNTAAKPASAKALAQNTAREPIQTKALARNTPQGTSALHPQNFAGHSSVAPHWAPVRMSAMSTPHATGHAATHPVAHVSARPGGEAHRR